VYGSDGYNVVGDAGSYPSYVTVTPSASGTFIWAGSSSNPSALQKAAATSDRIAACWYNAASFTVDVKFKDTASHRVGVYLLDWDGRRNQRVDVLDANQNTLDSRTVAGFSGGQYLVWNLSGHVILRFTNTGGANAVMSGLFFGGATVTSNVQFVKTDSTTRGSWKGVYGIDGYNVIGDQMSYPSYVTITPSASTYIWAASTSNVSALQKAASTTDRIAACWYGKSTLSVDVNFKDGASHQVALYMLDWDYGRSQRVDILDTNNNVQDSRTVTGFTGGQYLVWNLKGHVIIRITVTGGANPVMSGLFFGGSGTVTSNAVFVKTDTATLGSWQGTYGADGYNVIGNLASYPSYVTATVAGHRTYIWDNSTTDARGLEKASSSTDRIAACWYTATSFTIDLNFKDSNTHQVALYLLDWEVSGGGRSERVEILDANNIVLDTRTVSGFGNGQYLVWNVNGRVIVRVTNTQPASNAVVSGIFFR
jgi:hypothetical protein